MGFEAAVLGHYARAAFLPATPEGVMKRRGKKTLWLKKLHSLSLRDKCSFNSSPPPPGLPRWHQC